MLAVLIDPLSPQFWTNTLFVLGIIVTGIVLGIKKWRGDKDATATATELQLKAQLAITAQTAESWESLYRAEREAHAQTIGRLKILEGRVHTLEESHATVIELNVKQQVTIREQAHTINNLRQTLTNHEIKHDDIK